MNNVLMVAYFFPPHGGAGVQRTLKFAKYLPEFDWLPTILTASSRHYTPIDTTLANEIPPGTRIYRSPALLVPVQLPWRLRRLITQWGLVVDEQVGWLPFAVTAGNKIIAECEPEAIYSTSAPYTSHLIALRLANKWQLPWVADFRDPWIGNFNLRFPTSLHARIASRLEKQIISKANRIIVVSQAMRSHIISRYPGHNPSRFVVIPNGYDPQDFEDLEKVSLTERKFTITYTGSFYNERLTPSTFLLALKRLCDQRILDPGKVAVNFVGNISGQVQSQIDSLGLAEVARVVGYLDHRKSLSFLLSSELLLLIIGNHPGSEMVMTGKLFEYLAAKKPILSLSPPGVASDLIREAKAGVVVAPEDIAAIADQIEYYYRGWENGVVHPLPVAEVVERFDRRRLTSQLSKLLNNLE